MKQETLKKSWAFYELHLVLSRKGLYSIQRDLRHIFFFQIMTVRELQGRETYAYMFETREEEILRHCLLKFSF